MNLALSGHGCIIRALIIHVVCMLSTHPPLGRIGRQLLPWFNNALWQLMKKQDAALKKSLKSGLETDCLIYIRLRNKVTTQLRKTKVNFFLDNI